MKEVFKYNFSVQIKSPNDWVFSTSKISLTQVIPIWVSKKAMRAQEHASRIEKLTLCCAIQASPKWKLYYYIHKTVQRDEYNPMLEIDAWSAVQIIS